MTLFNNNFLGNLFLNWNLNLIGHSIWLLTIAMLWNFDYLLYTLLNLLDYFTLLHNHFFLLHKNWVFLFEDVGNFFFYNLVFWFFVHKQAFICIELNFFDRIRLMLMNYLLNLDYFLLPFHNLMIFIVWYFFFLSCQVRLFDFHILLFFLYDLFFLLNFLIAIFFIYHL